MALLCTFLYLSFLVNTCIIFFCCIFVFSYLLLLTTATPPPPNLVLKSNSHFFLLVILWVRHLNKAQWGWLVCCLWSVGLTQHGWVGEGGPNGFIHMCGSLMLAMNLVISLFLMRPLSNSISWTYLHGLWIPGGQREKQQGLFGPLLSNSHKISSAISS